jgi:uncharacterized protein with HEPN domain
LPKDDAVYAGQMLDCARRAIRLVDGKTRSDFDRDEVLALALTHLLQIIGEAARRVGPEFRRQHPGVPWKAIVGMRHRVVHDYLNIDQDIVWDVVSRDLPPLAAELALIVD